MGSRSRTEVDTSLVPYFSQKETWRERELCSALGISQEAVRKKLNRARVRLGFTVRRTRGDWIWSAPNGLFPEQMVLGKNEIVELLEALLYAPRNLLRELKQGLLSKVSGVDRDAFEAPVVMQEEWDEQTTETVRKLARAGRMRRVLQIKYRNAKGEEGFRNVSVLQLDSAGKKFTAWCHRRSELRFFLVSQVLFLSEQPSVGFHAVSASDLAAFLVPRTVFGYVGSGPFVECVFSIASSVPSASLRQMERELPKPIEREKRDGDVRFRMRIPSDAVFQLAGFLVRHGDRAHAETSNLREAVLELARACLKRHETILKTTETQGNRE